MHYYVERHNRRDTYPTVELLAQSLVDAPGGVIGVTGPRPRDLTESELRRLRKAISDTRGAARRAPSVEAESEQIAKSLGLA